jgi:alkylmercury lyase
MQQIRKAELIEGYREAYKAVPQELLELDFRLTIRTMQALSKGKPISPSKLASLWEVPIEQVQSVLEAAVANGNAEIDSDGNLVGGILSLNPTSHRISMNDQQLYAWCAYDAIYAPGVVGQTARIESEDPVTGTLIRVVVTPEGVEEVQPEGAVASIVKGNTDMRGGPESPRCTQMLFFESHQSAEQWLLDRTNVAILTVEEVFDLAEEFQIEPARQLGLV